MVKKATKKPNKTKDLMDQIRAAIDDSRYFFTGHAAERLDQREVTEGEEMTKKLEYNGLGFPVVLLGVKSKKTPYGDALDINHESLRKSVFKMLIEKHGRFLGAEIKFIRHEMEKSQEVFADMIFAERSSVAKWEKKDLKPTGMAEATEILLRIEMSKHLKTADLNKVYDKASKSVRSDKQELLKLTA